MKKIHLILLILWSFQWLPAQSAGIKGRLIDENSKAIAAANLYIAGTVLGGASSDDGAFFITKIPPGRYVLTISVLGYATKEIDVNLPAGQISDLGEISLKAIPLQSQPIIVTAGKYEQQAENVPVSISSISAQDMAQRNAVTIDDALRYVSGINMNLDQVNIRGSSGYAKGVGSRVMLLVDGVPYITGDTQGLVLEALPVNQIEKIEIVKGAGSALYGSNAMGGVINIITKPVGEKTKVSLKMYGGLYSEPYHEQWQWADKSRYLYGLKAYCEQRYNQLGISIAAVKDGDDSYRKNDWKERYNIGGKIEYDFSPFNRLIITGNYMDQKRGNFLYWKDLSHALTPPDSQLSEKVHSQRYYLSPVYRWIISQKAYFKISGIWFHNRFKDNIGNRGNHADSDFINGELQLGVQTGRHTLVFGVNPSYNKVQSNIFSSRKGLGAAVFIQDEFLWSEKWIATLGGRYDYYDIDIIGQNSSINPKIGLVFKPGGGSVLRFSAGTGFRAPSMAEAFASTSTGGITVIPNENLKAERSQSVELGLNQVFSKYLGADLALFYNYYENLIEGGFLPSGYIQFRNVTKARITGFELNADLHPLPRQLYLHLGYTYMDPQNISTDDYLTYRPRNLFYSNARWTIFGFVTGLDYRFISRYDRIDNTFSIIIPEAEQIVDAHILDLRVSKEFNYKSTTFNASFQINNLLQYHYNELIGSIGPIRHYVITFGVEL
ncbi:MAG: TonB-dependent receptor [Calditrichaceae bacterium]|nr:TonB-dependent receptor [Calditrichaceae bacterium]MBN2710158.1 TonB-dependent receptor [Calditrichaceae bacterium]